MRGKSIHRMRELGESWANIALICGITRQRAQQLYAKWRNGK